MLMMPHHHLHQHQQQQMMLDDPMTDHNFMAFLSLYSSSSNSEPTTPLFSSLPSSLLLLQHHTPPSIIPEATTPASLLSNSSNKRRHYNKKNSTATSNNSSTRIGQCEHPKHVIYRQEKYTLTSNTAEETNVLRTIPRRGRPPKGSKSTEFLFSTSPIISPSSSVFGSSLHQAQGYYPIVELTVRPLPKRLEAVVGKSNIKVCLTCLKRSDTDQEYLSSKLYIGPQQIYKKKKQQQ